MGKRKSGRKAPPKKKEKLDINFDCPFCAESKTTDYKADKASSTGYIHCRACFAGYRTKINKLTLAVDVYGEWIDDIERREKLKAKGLDPDLEPNEPIHKKNNISDDEDSVFGTGSSNVDNSDNPEEEYDDGLINQILSSNKNKKPITTTNDDYDQDYDEDYEQEEISNTKPKRNTFVVEDEEEEEEEMDEDDYEQDQSFKTGNNEKSKRSTFIMDDEDEEEEEEIIPKKPSRKSNKARESDYSDDDY